MRLRSVLIYRSILLLLSLIVVLISLFILAKEAKGVGNSTKRIEINLSSQRLSAFDGETTVFDFPVSSGKPWWPTPTGEFKPWARMVSTRMIGGSRQLGTFYDLPNVPYVIYFYKGYAIHGAYWHNNFGRPMSHGCVNVRPDQMKLLYFWAPNDVSVKIYGATPSV